MGIKSSCFYGKEKEDDLASMSASGEKKKITPPLESIVDRLLQPFSKRRKFSEHEGR